MATAASLKFSIESTWDGSGVRRAREDIEKLKRDVKELGDKITVRVKVEPSMVGFASKVRDGARGITVDVRVEPNLTGFQTRLNSALRGRDFTVRVKIEPDINASDWQARMRAAVRGLDLNVQIEPSPDGVQARLTALSALHDWHIDVRINLDTSSLNSLAAMLRRLGGSAGGASGSVGGLIGALTGLFTAVNLAKVAVASLAFNALTPLIATALQATTVLAGIPAAIAGIGLVAGTVAIGLDGMSEAFEGLAISGGEFAMSAGEFQALLDKEMMPAAHDFMWALRDLRWEWELLTAQVQTNLFQGLGQQMRELGDIYMPKLTTGFAGLSEELNKGIIRFMEKLKDPQYGAAIDNLFANITKAVGPATDAIGDFALGLLNIASAGSGALPQIANDLARIAENFRKWTENPENAEKVKRWILEGWDALKDIGGYIAEFVTQTLPKLGAWIDENKDGFKSWKDDIEGVIAVAGTLMTIFSGIGEAAEWVVIPLKLIHEALESLGGGPVAVVQSLKIALLDLAITAAEFAVTFLRANAAILDMIPGMGGVADKARAMADALEGGVIPGLKATRDELIAMQTAIAATKAVDDAMRSLADGTRVTTQEIAGLQNAFDAESRAMAAAGASMGQITDRRAELVAAFQETARAAGMAEVDIQKFSEKLLQIPPDIKTTVTADTQQFLFSFNDVYTLMNQLDAAQATPEVRAEVQSALADFKITADELANLDLTTASPEVIAIITEALSNLATVNNGLDETGNKKPMPQVGIVDNASGPLGGIQGQLNGLQDKTVTVTVNTVYAGAGASGSANVGGGYRGMRAPSKVPGLSIGGRVPGTGPGANVRDGFLGITSKGMPLVRVDKREWIVNRRSSDKYDRALSALNRDNPKAAMAALRQYVGSDRPGGSSRSSSSVSAVASQVSGVGGSLDVNVNVHVDGNANAETLRAAGQELAPQLVMAIKQGVGVRAKVAK